MDIIEISSTVTCNIFSYPSVYVWLSMSVCGCLYVCFTLEFFLNECHWIQRIQWIMTKSKNSIVITSNTYLDIVIVPVIVVGSTIFLISMGRYLLPPTTLNRYLSRYSSKKFIFTTSSENITLTRYGVFLITILILFFVTIHWIQWIQRKSFRNTSKR